MKKNKLLILIFFSLIFMVFGVSLVQALEVKYPVIPMLPNLNTNSPSLSAFVSYFFGLLTYVAAILALISFTVGAIGLINPNPEAHGDARDRMKGAVLGLGLTLAAFIILRTINPIFITPTLNPLSGVSGVFYYKTNPEAGKPALQRAMPQAEPNLPAWLAVTENTGFNTIQYCCEAPNSLNECPTSESGTALLIWEFPKPNFAGNDANYSGVQVKRVTCGQKEMIPSSVGSIKIGYDSPGVYFCLGTTGSNACGATMCSGMMSEAFTSSQNNIPAPFAGRIGGIRVVKSLPENNWGVIFHEKPNYTSGGKCNLPIISDPGVEFSQCIDIEAPNAPEKTYSANIFMVNNQFGTAGNGVSFYSEPWGDFSGQPAGYYDLPYDAIPPSFLIDPDPGQELCDDYYYYDGEYCAAQDAICYCYINTDIDPHYENVCIDFQDCPGSIKINGSYLVGLYSAHPSGTGYYCQTFTHDVNELELTNYLPSGADLENLHDVYVIPIQ